MRKEIPAGVLELLTIPGLRADKVIKLYQELELTWLEELEKAAREGKLQKVKGLGASLQTKILRGLELRREARGRRHMHKADELLRSAEKHLREARPEIIPITRAGDFRRGSELVGDLSLVAEVVKLPEGPKAITAGRQLTARLGCMMIINPDAHSTREIDLTHWGVEMARKGGVPKERVLNCLNKEEFAEYLANRRDQRRRKRLAPGRRIPRTRTVRAKAKKASLAARKKRSVAS